MQWGEVISIQQKWPFQTLKTIIGLQFPASKFQSLILRQPHTIQGEEKEKWHKTKRQDVTTFSKKAKENLRGDLGKGQIRF